MPLPYHCVSVYNTPGMSSDPTLLLEILFIFPSPKQLMYGQKKSPVRYTHTHTHILYTYIYIFGCAWSSLQSTGSRMFGFSSCIMQTYLPHGMWDLSSLTRDQTCIPCIGRQIPHHWTTRKVSSVDLTGLSPAFQSHNVPPSHHSLPWYMTSCVHTSLFC